MLPLPNGSGKRNVILIHGSAVLTSKCNWAPQATLISSLIIAANGAEGNQIDRDMMDWWRWEVGNLSRSHMQLSSWVHLAQLSYLDAEPQRTSQLWLWMSLRHAGSEHQTTCKIGHHISIWYPFAKMWWCGRAGGELGHSEIPIDPFQSSSILKRCV